MPAALRDYAKPIRGGSRILVPGCGSAYEAYYLLDSRFDLVEDKEVTDLIPVFEGAERWQVWGRR